MLKLVSLSLLLIFLLTFCCADQTISVDSSRVLTEIPRTFLGAGWETHTVIKAANYLENAKFTYLASQLSPAVIRVGGTSSDFTVYDVTDKTVGAWPTPTMTLNATTFKALVSFGSAAGVDLTFDLNELTGRNCSNAAQRCTGSWDTKNLKEFLTYIKENNIGPIYGFELGNELTQKPHISIQENIADYVELKAIFDSIWKTDPPKIFGPSTNICNDDTQTFMTKTKAFLAGYTYHTYPGGEGNSLPQQLVNVTWLRENIINQDAQAKSKICIDFWHTLGQSEGMKLWVTETGSAYRDTGGYTGMFQNGFWYLASLGQYAASGVSMHGRWSLTSQGGTHGLIKLDGPDIGVGPDYWAAVVFKRIVGTKVLGATVTADSGPVEILGYAFCGGRTLPQGSVVVAFVNPGRLILTVKVNGFNAAYPRSEYIFTANTLQSTTVKLNGNQLSLTSDGKLPQLDPKVVTSGDLVAPPSSYGFAVYQSAGVAACA